MSEGKRPDGADSEDVLAREVASRLRSSAGRIRVVSTREEAEALRKLIGPGGPPIIIVD